MPQYYPESLLNPTGVVDSGAAPPNLSPAARQVQTIIYHTRWVHMRMAWIVPVRGQVPWAETSEGRLLVDDNERAKSPFAKSNSYTQPIMWTPSLLQRFWEYLIRHREFNTLGSLAFALMPATKGGMLPDVIKVWCDAKMAMKVRTLLSIFHVEPPESPQAGHTATGDNESTGSRHSRTKTFTKPNKLITPLRRCRLVLLDDTGEPLLIS